MYTFSHLNDNVYVDHKQWKNDMFYACPERDCVFYKSGYYIGSYAYNSNRKIKRRSYIVNCTHMKDISLCYQNQSI